MGGEEDMLTCTVGVWYAVGEVDCANYSRYGGVCCGLAGKRQSTARWRMRRDEQADALRRWQS